MSIMQPLSPRVSKTEQVTVMIRSAITSGEMTPDQHYSAIGIAQRLGVSRTPVREALQLLEKEGIVSIEKNRGVRVQQISLDEIVEVFQIRLLLEPPAAGRAVQISTLENVEILNNLYQRIREAAAAGDGRLTLLADKEFHLYLLGLADNGRLISMIGELRNVVLSHGQVTIPHARTGQELVDDRQEILAAIRDRNPKEATAAMRSHVMRTAQLLIRSVCARTDGLDAEEYLRQLGNLES